MNDTNYEQELIRGYKEDFVKRTGKGLKCIIGTLREGSTSFVNDKIHFYTALDIILEYTGWSYKDLIGPSRIKNLILQRSIINYIIVNNGIPLTTIGFYMHRDHSTIINSIREFENLLETEFYTQKLFLEIFNNLKEHYDHSKVLTKQEFEDKYKANEEK